MHIVGSSLLVGNSEIKYFSLGKNGKNGENDVNLLIKESQAILPLFQGNMVNFLTFFLYQSI